jgi:hypothetical protein
MLTPAAMLTLAAELTDAQAHGNARSLAAIAWQLYGEAGEASPRSPGCGPPSMPRGIAPGKSRHPLQPEPNQLPPGTKAMSRSGPEAPRVPHRGHRQPAARKPAATAAPSPVQHAATGRHLAAPPNAAGVRSRGYLAAPLTPVRGARPPRARSWLTWAGRSVSPRW